jgi:hypothetical protein
VNLSSTQHYFLLFNSLLIFLINCPATMSSFAERISALFSNRLITSSRNRTTATIIGLLSFLGIVIGYNDYQAWKALGRGGMPYNIKGWLYQSMLRLKASNDITSTKCYDELMKQSELESRTFFSQELPVRKGAKPTMSTHIIPHRQLDHKANKGLVDVSSLHLQPYLIS